jgi:hypothetical protein
MNYYKAYKMLITGVNELVADGVYDPEVFIFETSMDEMVDADGGGWIFRGYTYFESDLILIDETAPQYVKNNIVQPLDFETVISYGWHYIVSKAPAQTLAEKYSEAIDRILDKGIVYDISGEISTYAIGSVETYLKYGEALGFQSDYSVFASVETYIKAPEAHLPIRQNKLFLPSINRLRVLDEVNAEVVDRLLDKGVAESGDWSLILRFVRDCKKWADLGGINVTDFSIIIDRILDKGIVFSQFTENSATISGVETYLKLAEAQGLTGGGGADIPV